MPCSHGLTIASSRFLPPSLLPFLPPSLPRALLQDTYNCFFGRRHTKREPSSGGREGGREGGRAGTRKRKGSQHLLTEEVTR